MWGDERGVGWSPKEKAREGEREKEREHKKLAGFGKAMIERREVRARKILKIVLKQNKTKQKKEENGESVDRDRKEDPRARRASEKNF